MTPTVSVVMPTRGRSDYVSRAIKTVLDQSFSDFELLILDNSPQPDRDRIVEMSKSDSRIHFVDRGNIGVTEARRLGALLSRGKLLALLDSDDYWDPERLEKHVAIWARNRIGLSWDRWAEVYEHSLKPWAQPFHEGPIPGRTVAVQLYTWNIIHASAGIVSAKFAQARGFPVLNVMSSDWMLFMRAAEHNQAYFIGDTLSFKELESPERVSNVETRDFFLKESKIIRRWALTHNPSIYGRQYLQTKADRILRRILNVESNPLTRKLSSTSRLETAKRRRTS